MEGRVVVLDGVEDELGVAVEPKPVEVEGGAGGEGEDWILL